MAHSGRADEEHAVVPAGKEADGQFVERLAGNEGVYSQVPVDKMVMNSKFSLTGLEAVIRCMIGYY